MISRPWRLSWKVLRVSIWRDRCRHSTLPGRRRQCRLSTKAINTVCWWRRQLWCRRQTHLLLGWGQQPRALESRGMPRRDTRARSSARTIAIYLHAVELVSKLCCRGSRSSVWKGCLGLMTVGRIGRSCVTWRWRALKPVWLLSCCTRPILETGLAELLCTRWWRPNRSWRSKRHR